jgi:TatD DNase family protein
MADMGVYFTIGIEVVYSGHIQAIARLIPSDQLLTETDNPGGPKDFIGGPGSPRLIEDVVNKVAELRSTKREEIISFVHSNLLHLIDEDPWFLDTDLAILGSRENGA